MPVYCCSSHDTPERIGRRFAVPPDTLCQLNALDDPRRLTEGLSLFLPENAPPRRELELLGCAYEPLPPSIRRESLSLFSWWAGDAVPSEESDALPLLLHANWDQTGSWSADTAHTLLNDPRTPDSLCQAVETGGFRGLYLLLAGLYAFDAPALTTLMETLALALHRAGRYLLLGLDLDEEALFPSAAAADRVVLLSPARLSTGPLPRPNAPLDRVRIRLDHAARCLSPERLLLGLSDYGSLWRSGQQEPISHLAAAHLAIATGTAIHWDSLAGECTFRCTDACGQPCVVWFQDLRSLQARLELVESFRLAGLALQCTPHLYRPGRELLRSRYETTITAS